MASQNSGSKSGKLPPVTSSPPPDTPPPSRGSSTSRTGKKGVVGDGRRRKDASSHSTSRATTSASQTESNDEPSSGTTKSADKPTICCPSTYPWTDGTPDTAGVGKLDMKKFILRHMLKGRTGMKNHHYMEYTVNELAQLLDEVKPIFERQPMLIELVAPVTVVGDIHGQFADLQRIFSSVGYPEKTNFLFLGDYIDRGPHNLECICLLLAYKCMYPDNFYILRGNHECRNINFIYGFLDELNARLPDRTVAASLFKKFNTCFSFMPLSALISGRILCMHGGISPHIKSLDSVREIKRPLLDVQGISQDLLWADPDQKAAPDGRFAPNAIRGISVQFGPQAVEDLCAALSLDLIVRAHQVVQDGYEFFADRKVLTIFSAPKYCDEFENAGGVLRIDKGLKCSLTILTPVATPMENKKSTLAATPSKTSRSKSKHEDHF